MTGRAVHFEIPTNDFDRARQFYQSAFGWNINRMPELDYASAGATPTDENGMPLEAGSINGGMFTRDQTLTGPVITIQVDDIEQVLERIGELGGETVSRNRTSWAWGSPRTSGTARAT